MATGEITESVGLFTANLHVTQVVEVPNESGTRGMAKKERREAARIVVQADTMEALRDKLGKHIELL